MINANCFRNCSAARSA